MNWYKQSQINNNIVRYVVRAIGEIVKRYFPQDIVKQEDARGYLTEEVRNVMNQCSPSCDQVKIWEHLDSLLHAGFPGLS